MRLLIAVMKHETNTFSPVPTPLARFGRGGAPFQLKSSSFQLTCARPQE